jgi:Uma2 family endonuclease
MNAPILAAQWAKARFTVAQIWALVEKGMIRPDARFELLHGQVVPMAPKGPLHEQLRQNVMHWLAGALHPHFNCLAETTLYLDAETFVEPDYVIYPTDIEIENLTPPNVLLAIEVSHESWPYDIGEKAMLYATHGVQEYWAIHAPSRLTRIHRGPSAQGWTDVRDVPAGRDISPICAPSAALKLEA